MYLGVIFDDAVIILNGLLKWKDTFVEEQLQGAVKMITETLRQPDRKNNLFYQIKELIGAADAEKLKEIDKQLTTQGTLLNLIFHKSSSKGWYSTFEYVRAGITKTKEQPWCLKVLKKIILSRTTALTKSASSATRSP